MKILFENKSSIKPSVSIILLDWSCRESFHSLKYLNDQTVPRERYEIIWIEYYNRRSPEIELQLKEHERLDKAPIVDKCIVMGMPEDVYYHKHLMYNVGIIASRGRITTFCDSDAIFTQTFVESIIKSFDEDRNIVLHMDEVRNTDRRFYPFNCPSIKDILDKGCINWSGDNTAGLYDKKDPIHTLNYGACMSALREDLINIGGADEHMDYLGHICGPYEMTFRLVNMGKKERWHQKEFLYHVWHPGTDGKGNYLGPHDGRNFSSTALAARKTGRVMPLVENPAIRMLRLKEDEVIYEPIFFQAVPEEEVKRWTFDSLKRLEKQKTFWKINNFLKKPLTSFRLTVTFFKMLIKQLKMKVTKFSRQPKSPMDILRKIFKTYEFLKNMSTYNNYVIQKCNECLARLAFENVNHFGVFGTGEIAEVLYKLSLETPVRINAVFGYSEDKKFFDFVVIPLTTVKDYSGKIVVATLTEGENQVEMLKRAGVKPEDIILL